MPWILWLLHGPRSARHTGVLSANTNTAAHLLAVWRRTAHILRTGRHQPRVPERRWSADAERAGHVAHVAGGRRWHSTADGTGGLMVVLLSLVSGIVHGNGLIGEHNSLRMALGWFVGFLVLVSLCSLSRPFYV